MYEIIPKPAKHLSKIHMYANAIPSPAEIYKSTALFLYENNCLAAIPATLIEDYALAQHFNIAMQYEAVQNAFVPDKDPEGTSATQYIESMRAFQENAYFAWSPIAKIVEQHSEAQQYQ